MCHEIIFSRPKTSRDSRKTKLRFTFPQNIQIQVIGTFSIHGLKCFLNVGFLDTGSIIMFYSGLIKENLQQF